MTCPGTCHSERSEESLPKSCVIIFPLQSRRICTTLVQCVKDMVQRRSSHGSNRYINRRETGPADAGSAATLKRRGIGPASRSHIHPPCDGTQNDRAAR